MSGPACWWAAEVAKRHGPRGREPLLTKTACAVLKDIAAVADDKTLKMWHGVESLGRSTGASERAVQYALRQLEAIPAIQCLSNRNGGRKRPRTYGLLIPNAWIAHVQARGGSYKAFGSLVSVQADPEPEKRTKNARKTPENRTEVGDFNDLAQNKLQQMVSKTEAIAYQQVEVNEINHLDTQKGANLDTQKGANTAPFEPGKGAMVAPEFFKKEPNPPSKRAGARRVEGEEGIEQGLVGRSVPSLEATEPAAALVVTGSEFVVAGSTEPNKPQPELHGDGADGEAPTNLPENNRPTRSTEADSIAQQITALERTRAMMQLHFPTTSTANLDAELVKLREALGPPVAQLHVLQQSQVRSATAVVTVEGALGFPVPIVQQDQGLAATATLTGKPAPGYWHPPTPHAEQQTGTR